MPCPRAGVDPKSPCRGPLQDAPARVFWKDQQGTIGLRATYGDGTIIALADDYPLTNIGISQGDNGLLLANVVREMSARYPGRVAFDEFHLGLYEHEASPLAIITLMLSGPWRWAAVQAALVGALALAARAVRFGGPQDVVHKPRRQHREFAEAAGRLFDEAECHLPCRRDPQPLLSRADLQAAPRRSPSGRSATL